MIGEGKGGRIVPEEPPSSRKSYLGDGVYVDVDLGLGLVLTTENGLAVTNRIVLEPEVYSNLVRYVERLGRQLAHERREQHGTPHTNQ